MYNPSEPQNGMSSKIIYKTEFIFCSHIYIAVFETFWKIYFDVGPLFCKKNVTDVLIKQIQPYS